MATAAFWGLVDYQCSGHKIAQALVPGIQEHGHHAHAVETGKIIDEPDQVAGYCFKGIDGTAGVLDDANAGPALARGLSFPGDFENDVVTPENQEEQERGQRVDP